MISKCLVLVHLLASIVALVGFNRSIVKENDLSGPDDFEDSVVQSTSNPTTASSEQPAHLSRRGLQKNWSSLTSGGDALRLVREARSRLPAPHWARAVRSGTVAQEPSRVRTVALVGCVLCTCVVCCVSVLCVVCVVWADVFVCGWVSVCMM